LILFVVSVSLVLPTVASPRSDSLVLSRSEFLVSSSRFHRGVRRSTCSCSRSLPQPQVCVSRGSSSLFLLSFAQFHLSRSESLCHGRCLVRPPFSARWFHVAWPGFHLCLRGYHRLMFSGRGWCPHHRCARFPHKILSSEHSVSFLRCLLIVHQVLRPDLVLCQAITSSPLVLLMLQEPPK
jgi:hypothetical protein